MSERLTAVALIDQLCNAGKKYELNGRIIKQSALFAYASELAVFLVEVFGSITELLTTFYDCTPNDSSKPWVNHSMKQGERKIYGPCLNILGASTKAWLKKCIPRSEMEGGFTSRIIFVVENNLPKKLIAWPEIAKNNADVHGKLVEDMQHIFKLAGEVAVTQEARKLFTRWYEHHMRVILPKNNDPRMVGYMSRKGDTILKLAIIRSASLRDDLVIQKEDIIWAQEELDALELDWQMAFDGIGTVSNLSYLVLELINKRIAIRKNELLAHFAQLYPVAEILKAVHDLKEMGEMVDFTKMHEGKQIEFYAIHGHEELINFTD